MSEFKPTASQKAAIETRDSAVLISAGAGSGKTKVLTERLMGYLCDETRPVDIDSFLIITFTRAAAGELRGRITQELGARLALEPGNRRLRRQSALAQRAQIGTIHSFCAAVLRENSHLTGLSPDFKIVDEERAETMRAASLERVLESRYEKPDSYPGFTRLADTVGAGRDDSRLMKLVLNLHGRMQSHARPELWAKGQVEQLKAPARDVAETPWGREVMDWAEGIVEYWGHEFDALMEQMRGEEKISAAYMESFSETGAQLRALEKALRESWDRAAERRRVEFPRLGSLRNSPNPELSDRLKNRREACKKDMKTIEKTFGRGSDALLRELGQTSPAMEALLSLTLDFDALYAKDKKNRGLVDYSDLEHITARLLTGEDGCPTELAVQLSMRYTEIMVDEYQDVSRVQDAIFRAISRDGKNLFMVGDVKQSIYRFRLAEPKIFNEKYLGYADDADAAPGEARRILLRENFRSRREILEGVNSVFSLCMSRALGDMDYDGAAALRLGAAYPGSVPKPELLILDASQESEDEESPSVAVQEAEFTAERIKALVASSATVTDRGMQRPIEYGDIAILLRSPGTIGGVYRRALTERGIPVSSVQGAGFFGSVEVSAVVSLMAVIDNPHQDIPLIAALRSPAFGFSADELSRIRAADRQGDFYTALESAAGAEPRAEDFLGRLHELRRLSVDLSAAELVWTILERLDMLAVCSAMDDGEQRRANLMALVELSERFEGTGYRGLHRFVLWLRKLAEKGQEPSAGAAAGSAVQIMSIHKSKGLEFPVVFLGNTAKPFNRQDSRDTVLVHPELGLGPRFTDTERRAEYPTIARNAIKLRLERELLSEEMRLLYVALTRAKERLYMTASIRNAEKKIESLRAQLSVPMAPEMLRQASSMAIWLIYSCLADEGQSLNMTVCHGGESRTESAACEAEELRADESAAKLLRENLAFRYGYEDAVCLPSKVTATELKGHQEEDGDAETLSPKREFSFALPDFAKAQRAVTGAERGIATHLVLQYMDYKKAQSIEGIEEEIARLSAGRYLSEREASAVDAAAIEKLFASKLGKRMQSADRLIREFKFSLLWDADEVFHEAQGEKLLMQGVVDCCIFEPEGITVIDYKTDRVKSAAALGERTELYRGQLMAYARAMERIYKMPVRECVLYFLSAGKSVTVYKNSGK